MDAFYRTSLYAGAAANAFFIIDLCQLVNHMNGVVLTGTLAFAAGDTTVFADRASRFAVLMIGAYHVYRSGQPMPQNQMLGTFADADAAAGTDIPVDHRNPILDRNCSVRTGIDTIPKAQTSVGAGSVSCK